MDKINYTIKIIQQTCNFNLDTMYLNIFNVRQKYPTTDQDFEDLIMDSYIKYSNWVKDQNKNKDNLFITILKNKIKDFYKKHNRMMLYDDIQKEMNMKVPIRGYAIDHSLYEETIEESFI